MKSTTTKRVVWACLVNGFAWVWCSYLLAYLGRAEIAESLSKVAITEIIGAVQYASIQNAAMANRQVINQAQVRLSTDTARQIADLRAQGEFEKADALLELSQTYLAKLVEVEQWSADYNMSKAKLEESIREWEAGYNLDVAKFEESVRQWEASFLESIRQWEAEFQAQLAQWDAEFELSESSLMGSYQGSPTLSATQTNNKNMADAGWTMLQNGIIPSVSQLGAMGINKNQAEEFIQALKLSQSSGGSGSSGGGVNLDDVETDKEPDVDTQPLKWLEYNNISVDEAAAVLRKQGYTDDYAFELAEQYRTQKEQANKNNSGWKVDSDSNLGTYGTAYPIALSQATMMKRQGKSAAEIDAFITGTYTDMTRLTAAGRVAIAKALGLTF